MLPSAPENCTGEVHSVLRIVSVVPSPFAVAATTHIFSPVLGVCGVLNHPVLPTCSPDSPFAAGAPVIVPAPVPDSATVIVGKEFPTDPGLFAEFLYRYTRAVELPCIPSLIFPIEKVVVTCLLVLSGSDFSLAVIVKSIGVAE